MNAQHRERCDDGFTMMEVVIAMAVFTTLAGVCLGMLVNTSRVARSNIQRTAAAGLATRQIESVRSLGVLEIPDGQEVTTRTVGGTSYTITQTANFVPTNSAASICTSTGNTLAYKLVTVKITWPEMGNVKPVRSDTLRAVGIGSDGLDAAKGTLAVLVSGASGLPTENVAVTLSPGGATRTTGADGCAVFTGLTPGTFSASASQSGYVGNLNTVTATVGSLGVVANEVRRATLLYDAARTVTTAFDAPATAHVPSGLPMRAGNTYVPEATLPACPGGSPTLACSTGVPGQIKSLFPEVYAIKAGSCVESTPSQVSVDLRPAGATSMTATIPVGSVTVGVLKAGVPQIGRVITALHAPGVGCLLGETYQLPSSAAYGTPLMLPYGTWTISTPYGTPQIVTLSPSNKNVVLTMAVTL